MKFTNEKEIKKCIAMIEIGERLKVDPTKHIDRVVKIMNGEIPTRKKFRGY